MLRHNLLLLHFLAKHGLKGPQDLLLVVLTKHVGEFGHFFALFGAADEVFSHDTELNFLALLLDVSGDDLVDGDELLEVE